MNQKVDELNSTEQEIYNEILQLIGCANNSNFYKEVLISRLDALIDELLKRYK